MEGLKDYRLHEHPLIYNDDQQEDWCCVACGLPLLLSPSYRCNKDCNFFLHKACQQLPEKINYVASNGSEYSLSLVVKPRNEAWTCYVCGELCKNLIVYCNNQWPDGVEIYVDALCAFPLEIKSKHDSHEHELVAMRREAQLLCDVCKTKQTGYFFSCREYSCDFWVHKDCTLLPRVIKITNHYNPLIFSYSLYGVIFRMGLENSNRCIVCNEKFTGSAGYCCLFCGSLVHSNCAISNSENLGYQAPVQFPLDEAEKSLSIYKMLDKKRIVEKNNDKDEKLSMEKYHNHTLIFHDINDKDSSSKYSLCDACILPVNSPPFYGCEEPGCDFLLHPHCTKLPFIINLDSFDGYSWATEKSSTLKLKADQLSSLFACNIHGHICNGFGYHSHGDAIRRIDLECSSTPRTIKHKLHHAQHILYLILCGDRQGVHQFACCSGNERDAYCGVYHVYSCASCSFKIHSRCALLPTKVSHKFDKHPLQLSSGTNVNDEYSFCEICEGHVDTKYWFYHCKDCDQLFHGNCLPSVGWLSKIKFGGSFVIPCHREDHPVIFTRMLEIGSQRCWECKDVIQGFVDDMAFQCLECCYWFHFRCALPKIAKDLDFHFYSLMY